MAVLGEKLLQNNQSLRNFCFWGCKEAALSLMWHNFLFYVEKYSDNADADVSKECCSVSPNAVRCPVKRGKDISYDRSCNIFASRWMHVGLNLCVLSEIYESETRDAQVDGSLYIKFPIFSTNILEMYALNVGCRHVPKTHRKGSIFVCSFLFENSTFPGPFPYYGYLVAILDDVIGPPSLAVSHNMYRIE